MWYFPVSLLSYSYSVFATCTTITFPFSGPCGAQYVAGAHKYLMVQGLVSILGHPITESVLPGITSCVSAALHLLYVKTLINNANLSRKRAIKQKTDDPLCFLKPSVNSHTAADEDHPGLHLPNHKAN